MTSSLEYTPLSTPQLSHTSLNEEHPYAWDIVSTMIYHACGLQVPELSEVHEARTCFSEYWSRYRDLLHTLDWAEAWRENRVVNLVWMDLERVETAKSEATKLYLNAHYQESEQKIRSALQAMDQAVKHAKISLSKAILWVHLIESTTLASTALITISIAIYFLEEKRIKEVGRTRLRPKTKNEER